MKVHHVGYLVKKLDKAAEEFEKLGFVRQGDMTNDTYRKVDILFLEKDGYVVELVSPNAPDSVVSGLIKTCLLYTSCSGNCGGRWEGRHLRHI